ncbi:MAG TPA: YkgJ family cysteine cluster protein [Rhizomicrobium sp.]|jgi:Fe-S-cluster containining protein|nr:YkgJ family cysteine cluster protein [Rhizomicrobium sp.]
MYDCSKCPGYCCSYPIIPINKKDVQRLAKHFDMSFEKARKKFTKSTKDDKYVMRRQKDEHFGKICQFFDTDERRCTIYHARPSTCRDYPHGNKCGYYEFLKFERDLQDDPDEIASTENS